MSVLTRQSICIPEPPSPSLGDPSADALFHYAVAILGFLAVCGLGVDGWSHRHLVTESFFTPSHALMYGAVSLLAIVILREALRNYRRGYTPTHLLPKGYMLSLLGVLGAGAGAPIDFLWHLVNGAEISVDALVSPTHVFVAFSAGLTFTGPLRAGIISQVPPRLRAQFPMILSAATLFMLLQFFTQYALAFDAGFSKAMAPIGYQHATTSGNLAQLTTLVYRETLGIFEVFLRAAILGGFIVFLTRSIRLAPGAFTSFFMLGLPTIFIVTANDATTYLINLFTALGGGLFADFLYRTSSPYRNQNRFRAFAPCVLSVYFSLFFLLEATFGGGLWWDANYLAGTIALVAVIGLLLSLLSTAPAARPQAT